MKSWTIDEMLAENPCEEYTRERLEELYAGRESLSLLEILDVDIPAEDRMWVAFRPGALTDGQRDALLGLIVTRAVSKHALDCGIPRGEAWAQRWLSGEDRSRSAAWVVTQEAGAGTAWGAVLGAWAAAWAALLAARVARAEARAAEDVAWEARAAEDAASAARWAAAAQASEGGELKEREQQIKDLKSVLGL